MKESDNTKNFGSIVIPKARGVPKSCFVSVLSRRQKISALVCLALDKRFTITFSHVRLLSPVPRGRRKGLEDKTYPAMDLLVHGEFDGALGRGLHPYVMIVLLNVCSL